MLSSLLNKKRLSQSSNQQDEDELYQEEVEYDAMPLEQPVDEVVTDVTLNFEGENSDPVVCVPGLLAYDRIEVPLPGGRELTLADYWCDVKELVEDPIIVSPSSLASLHDRAVEIFYQLKGGQVDYGATHSQQFCHKQYGKIYEGLMPDWNEDNPIVLIGKGYGATTALHLQHLLSNNFFGENTSGAWVKAVICLSAPHRGSVLPYALGLEPSTKTTIHPLSLLQLFLSFVHIICYFKWLDALFGFQLNDKWSLTSKRSSGKQSLWTSLCGRSGFSQFADNFMVDWSVEGARSRYAIDDNDRHKLDRNCVYINYITTGQSWRSKETGNFWPRITWRNWPTAIISAILGRYKLSPEVEQQVLRTSSANFWDNDGTLAVYSQLPPPHQPTQMTIALSDELFDPVKHELNPGAWYNVYVNDRSETLLFKDEPFLCGISFIATMLEWSFFVRLADFLATHSDLMEEVYVRGVEFAEKQFKHLRIVLRLDDGSYPDHTTDLRYKNVASTKSSLQDITVISERLEQRCSDKAGNDWIHNVEQHEISNSPSKMIFWMQQIEKSGSAKTGNTSASSPRSVSPDRKESIYGDGPMFVKTRRRRTADEYIAEINVGNNGSNGGSNVIGSF